MNFMEMASKRVNNGSVIRSKPAPVGLGADISAGMDDERNDPFKLAFESFRHSLTNAKPDDSRRQSVDEKLSVFANDDLRSSATLRLQQIRSLRSKALKQLESELTVNAFQIKSAESSHFEALSAGVRHKNFTERRLMQQVVGADRRMRELVFEILGEYGKSDVRVSRRKEYLLYAARLKLVARISSLRWQRFALRLCDELINHSDYEEGYSELKQSPLVPKVLCHEMNSNEWYRVKNALEKKLAEPMVITSIVRLDKRLPLSKKGRAAQGAGHAGAGGQALLGSPLPVRLAAGSTSTPISRSMTPPLHMISSSLELAGALESLRGWSRGPRIETNSLPHVSKSPRSQSQNANANANSPQKASSASTPVPPSFSGDLLSMSRVAWFHPTSYYPAIWDKVHEYSKSHEELAPENSAENDTSNSDDSLERFLDVFSSQHTSFIASDMVYYCLEERCALLEGISKAKHSSAKGEEAAADLASYELLQNLEKLYLPKGEEIDDIRGVSDKEPLYVEEFLSHHQDASFIHKVIPSALSPAVQLLESFPNVVRTKTKMTDASRQHYFHFAPAIGMNLVETEAVRQYLSDEKVFPSKEVIDNIASVRHPKLDYFISQLSDRANKGSEAATGADNEDLQRKKSMQSRSELDRFYFRVEVVPVSIFQSEQDRSTKIASNNGSGEDSPRAKSFQIMLPLSSPCMRELLLNTLGTVKTTTPYLPSKMNGSLQLLPDSARQRIRVINETPGGKGDPLRFRYAFLYGEDFSGGTSSSGSGSGSGHDATPNSSDVLSDCCYLVQLGHESGYGPGYFGNKNGSDSAQEDVNTGVASPRMSDNEDDRLLKTLLLSYLSHSAEQMGLPAWTPRAKRTVSGDFSQPQSSAPLPLGAIPKSGSKIVNVGQILREVSAGVADTTSSGTDGNMNSNNNGSSSSSSSSKKQWDVAIMSSVCRWRSCMCESMNLSGFQGIATSSANMYLCPFHMELKLFLDGKATTKSGSDALRYLPRKMPSMSTNASSSSAHGDASPQSSKQIVDTSKKDLAVIRAASTLLQELWDGKLKATLRSFVKKTAQDLRFKKRIELIHSAAAGAHPVVAAFVAVANANLITISPLGIGGGGSIASDGLRTRKLNPSSNTAGATLGAGGAIVPKPPGDLSPKRGLNRNNLLSSTDPPAAAVAASAPVYVSPAAKICGLDLLALMSHVMGTSLPVRPQWATWKDKELFEKTALGVADAHQILMNILVAEKAATEEVQILERLGVFPSIELAQIKKDMKVFKEQNDAVLKYISTAFAAVERAASAGSDADGNTRGEKRPVTEYGDVLEMMNAQLGVVERKVSVLVARRQDEQEARAAYLRKVARAKAIEEAQSKDPLNFRNQKRF